LAKNYDENAKKPDRDPRGAFKNPSEMAGAAAAGIVGPLGSSSFNMPNVERALKEMESGTGANLPGNADARRGMTVGHLPSAISDFTSAGRGGVSPVSASPSLNTGQTQHEVLQNFFQSLLSSKDRAGSGAVASAPRQSIAKANSTSSGTDDVTGYDVTG
jgi:dynein light intermediate chain 1